MDNIKVIKQRMKIPISNIEVENERANKRAAFHKHSILLPNSIRCITVGPSNCHIKFVRKSKWVTL